MFTTKWTKWVLIISVSLTCLSCKSLVGPTSAQSKVPLDKTAENFYNLGEEQFRQRNYANASNLFENACLRKFNQVTTASIYMAGLSYYYQQEDARALEKFQALLTTYAASKYADDASYHKALVMLRTPGNEKGGLYVLLNLIEQTTNDGLKRTAEAAAMMFFYQQSSTSFLQEYYGIVRASYKTKVLEALAYRLHKENKEAELEALLTDVEKEGGTLTPNLAKLRKVKAPVYDTELRIAVMLPFLSGRADTSIDKTSQVALQLYEGMRLALEQNKFPTLRKVVLKVVDTEDSPSKARQLLQSDILPFKPHLIIGDVRNQASKAITEAIQAQGIVQVIPLSDAEELLQTGNQTYLANPSTLTAAQAQAKYAVENRGHKNFMVLCENLAASEQMADAFIKTVEELGGKATKKILPLDPKNAAESLVYVGQQMLRTKFDALYVPISNQESVSLTLYRMSQDSIPLQVIGTERWRTFRSMDQELLSEFKVLITDSYDPGNDEATYESFEHAYLTKFHAPPSPFALQGYDLMRFLLYSFGANQPLASMPELFSKAKVFKGMGQNFYFGNARTNQSVQILEYTTEGWVRQYAWKK